MTDSSSTEEVYTIDADSNATSPNFEADSNDKSVESLGEEKTTATRGDDVTKSFKKLLEGSGGASDDPAMKDIEIDHQDGEQNTSNEAIQSLVGMIITLSSRYSDRIRGTVAEESKLDEGGLDIEIEQRRFKWGSNRRKHRELINTNGFSDDHTVELVMAVRAYVKEQYAIFSRYDRDKNVSLDREEYVRLFRETLFNGDMNETLSLAISADFDRIDINGDGSISFREFVEHRHLNKWEAILKEKYEEFKQRYPRLREGYATCIRL